MVLERGGGRRGRQVRMAYITTGESQKEENNIPLRQAPTVSMKAIQPLVLAN